MFPALQYSLGGGVQSQSKTRVCGDARPGPGSLVAADLTLFGWEKSSSFCDQRVLKHRKSKMVPILARFLITYVDTVDKFCPVCVSSRRLGVEQEGGGGVFQNDELSPSRTGRGYIRDSLIQLIAHAPPARWCALWSSLAPPSTHKVLLHRGRVPR